MAKREDLKRIRARFEDVVRHTLLNDVAHAISMELNERAHMDMPAPLDRTESGSTISMKILFQGELSERDRRAVREVMQSVNNQSNLLFLLRKHKK